MPRADEDSTLRPRIGLVAGAALFSIMLLAPAPEGLSPAGWHTAAVGVLMALWWMTEALPIAVTALLPIVLFPVLGVAAVGETTAPYANPLIFLFLGGFVIALGMQRWNLHRRIALEIIRAVGTRPRRIIAGFMIASGFLSMWISNTATTMMMLPIGMSVVEIVGRGDERPGSSDPKDRRGRSFALALMLSIAYASSIGGIATIIGSPPNALMVGFMDETYGIQIDFLHWMGIGVPVALVGLAASYVLLVNVVFPVKLDELPGGAELIRDALRRMGPMRGPERAVALIFALTAGLWMTRPLVGRLVPGLSDTGIALFGAVLLFLVPVDWRRGEFLLEWSRARQLPWGMLLLFGGGLSLASAVRTTGLAEWIGIRLQGLHALPEVLIVLTVITTVILLTELTSNTATTATFLPIVASVAVSMGENPLLLLLPATVAASCAFMMPVATPPNAIVYGSGHVTIPQMVRAGVWLNALFLLVILVAAYTVLPWVMGVEPGVVPAWAR